MTDREATVTWRRYLLGILLISSINWGAVAWLYSLCAEPDSAAVSRIVSIMQSPMSFLGWRIFHLSRGPQLAAGAAIAWAAFAGIALAVLFAMRQRIATRPRSAIPIWAYGLYGAGAYAVAAIAAIATGGGARSGWALGLQLIGATLQFSLGLLVGTIVEAFASRTRFNEGHNRRICIYTQFEPARTWRTYLIIWLGSLLPLTVLHLLIDPGGISVPMRLLAGVGNLFGPYTTFVLWPVSFPNGGEFPRVFLPYLIFVTAGMLIAVVLPLCLRRECGRVTCLAFFTLVLLAWLAMGVMEIAFLVT